MATNAQPDYSESIIIPGKIPEHMEAHYTALKRAKKVIHILSQSALSAKTRAYSILHGTHEDMILPEQYQFERFVIRFLPGWGTYSVILEDDRRALSQKSSRKRRIRNGSLKNRVLLGSIL